LNDQYGNNNADVEGPELNEKLLQSAMIIICSMLVVIAKHSLIVHQTRGKMRFLSLIYTNYTVFQTTFIIHIFITKIMWMYNLLPSPTVFAKKRKKWIEICNSKLPYQYHVFNGALYYYLILIRTHVLVQVEKMIICILL